MTEHPHIALVRQGYDAFATGDMATIDSLWHDDIVWHEPGNNPLAGTHKGKQQIFEMLGRLMELTDGTFTVTVDGITANDDYAVAVTTASVTRNGRSVTGTSIDIIRILDGKTIEFWANVTESLALDDLFDD